MRSTRNFWASVVFLLAIPVAVVLQALFGIEAETILHFELYVGLGLLRISDFKTPAWLSMAGIVSAMLLGLTFFLQGFAQITGYEFINWLGFQVLGGWPESFFVDLLFVWLIGVLLTDSKGKSQILGFICMTLAVGVKIYSYILPMLGTSLDENYPVLKVLLLIPFLWLLLEARNGRKRDRELHAY